MEFYAGTSGFSYTAWKGPFYPEDLPASKMLSWYAEQLRCVEMNNTFYRFPTEELVAKWATQVPAGFRFAVKAPQFITHRRKLKDVEDSTRDLCAVTSQGMGERLGCLLFQLPPYLRLDLPLLREFLEQLPATIDASFEFRHESWYDDAVFSLLRQHDRALCVAETDDGINDAAWVATASWGYLRLRRGDYDEAQLSAWAAWIREQAWRRAFVFFKHEDEGIAPRLALKLCDLLD